MPPTPSDTTGAPSAEAAPEKPAPAEASNGKGSEDVAAGVKAALADAAQPAKEGPTKEEIARATQLHQQRQLAMLLAQRQGIACSLLSGMLAGAYGQLLTGELKSNFGDRMIEDAYRFADKMIQLGSKLPDPPAN